jgi:hypothetical protein
MGNCCAAEHNTQETNLRDRGQTKGGERYEHIPIATVLKFQSIIRGFLTRRRVKKAYGFEMTHGLMNRGTNVHVEMDPEKLEE